MLVDEWVRAGVTDAVVCPGSRSTPMALALAEHPSMRVHVHLDERSGSFMALGLARALGRPSVVVTTSGTAAAELHSAVAEADLDGVPLLLVTADRPPEARGVGSAQTIDQTGLFGSMVREFIDPGPPAASAAGSWRSVAARAVAAASGPWPGPVHLNLPFREPLLGRPVIDPPGRPHGAPWHGAPWPGRPHGAQGVGTSAIGSIGTIGTSGPDGLAPLFAAARGLIVAGGGVDDAEAVMAFARRRGWPVLADPRSGCRRHDPLSIAHFDAIARSAHPALRPEVILRLGSPPASKVLGTWLADSGAMSVSIADGPFPADPARSADHHLHGSPVAILRTLDELQVAGEIDPLWATQWRAADDAAAAAAESVLAGPECTEPGTARALIRALPADAALVSSSSMPVRDVEWFGPCRDGLRYFSNRGANGIDGVVSTAVGVAAAGGPTALLIGDIAFLHDVNGLIGAATRGLDLCIVVIDNDGGGIFSFLPQATALSTERFEQLFGTPHGVDLGALASAHGITVLEASESAGVEIAVAASLAAGGVHVVIVRTDRQRNVVIHDELHRSMTEAIAKALGSGANQRAE